MQLLRDGDRLGVGNLSMMFLNLDLSLGLLSIGDFITLGKFGTGPRDLVCRLSGRVSGELSFFSFCPVGGED